MGLSLTPTGVDNKPKISLSTPNEPTYSPDHVEDLARKYSVALGEDSPGARTIGDVMMQGREQQYRSLMASKKANEAESVRIGLIEELVASGQTPSQMDIEIVKGLSNTQVESPDLATILEEEYARKATDIGASQVDEDTGLFRQAMVDNPDTALEILDRSQYTTARNLILNNKINEINNKWDKTNLLEKGWAWAQVLVPFKSDLTMINAVEGSPKALLVGDALKEKISYMYSLTPAEFKRTLDNEINGIMQWGNYLDAQRFLNALHSYGNTDAAWDSAFQGIDVATSVSLATLKNVAKGISRAASGKLGNMVDVSVEVGRNDLAAQRKIVDNIRQKKSPFEAAPNHMSEVEDSVPSVARPHQTFTERPKMTPAAIDRLTLSLKKQDDIVTAALTDPNLVQRLSPQQLDTAFRRAEEDLANTFRHDKYSIVDMIRHDSAENVANVNTVTVRLGAKNGNFFISEKQALKAAEHIGLKTTDYKIVSQAPTGDLKPNQLAGITGGRYSIEITRPVREDGLRGIEIETTHKTPDSIATQFLGFLRSPDYKLSPAQVEARGVAVYSTEHLSNMMSELAKPIGKVNKKELKELDQAFRYNRLQDGDKKSSLFEKVSELEDYFYEKFNHLPSEAQVEAYFAYKNLSDLDYYIRKFDVYKQKTRLGIENVRFRFNIEGSVSNEIRSEMRLVDSLPESKNDYKVALVQDGKVTKQFFTKKPSMVKVGDDNITFKEYVKSLEDLGYRIFQNYDGSLELGDRGKFQYVVTRDFKRNALDINDQLAYNPGHKVHKYPFYGKQSIVDRKDGMLSYYGDRSIFNIRSQDEAERMIPVWNDALRMIREKDPNAQKFVEENLPISYKELTKKIDDGLIDPTERIYVTRSGESTKSYFSAGKRTEDWFDAASDEHNLAAQVGGRFLGEKGVDELDTYAMNQDNTIFKFEGDTILDPIEALKVGLQNAVNVRVMNDYRVKSAEDFLREFGQYLDIPTDELRTQNVDFLYNPRYLKDTPGDVQRKAEEVRKSIVELVGQRTWVEKAVDIHKERIVASVRGKLGDNVAEWVQDRALPTLSRTDQFMRSYAFHTKMGMFNPRHLFLQATAIANVVSITPRAGAKAALSLTPIMMALRFPNKVDVAASLARGWDKKEFKEMIDSFKRSGYAKVGNDTSYRDLLASPEVRKGKFKHVLDLGSVPFNTGEKIARSTAWAAAYQEWRAANVGKALDRAGEARILQRAKDLTGNMTRDSNARWQKGYLSIVTQFFGAQARLTEQMLGAGKLTRAEKARLFLGMSSLYGVPVGVGMTVGVLPVREMLTNMFAENGYSYDNTVVEPFVDGFLSSMAEYLTGGDLNFSEKFGLGGIPTFYELWKGDAELTEAFMGASGSIVWDTMSDTLPFLQQLWSLADPNDPTIVQDLVAPFRNISSVNSTVKLIEASNTGKWLSQNGIILTDISGGEALVSALTGLDPERVSDAFNKAGAMSTWKKHEASVRRDMIRDYRLALDAYRNGDDDLGDKLTKRAQAAGVRLGFNDQDMRRVLVDAMQETGFDDVIAERFNKKVTERNQH